MTRIKTLKMTLTNDNGETTTVQISCSPNDGDMDIILGGDTSIENMDDPFGAISILMDYIKDLAKEAPGILDYLRDLPSEVN